ncbi:beta-lactamase domain protein [Pelomyxa schiedti]|nr:beta-lactamase domain protein [Pelomyxa schiedti]
MDTGPTTTGAQAQGISVNKMIFMGTGTSGGVPLVGCSCPVCMSTDPYDKRLRTSALLILGTHPTTVPPPKPRSSLSPATTTGGPGTSTACDARADNSTGTTAQGEGETLKERTPMQFAVDVGPDFRQQALTHRLTYMDFALLTHAHQDHIGGIDELRQLNYYMKTSIPLYANHDTCEALRHRFDYIFAPFRGALGGGLPDLTLHQVEPLVPIVIGGLSITPLPVFHGDMPILGYAFHGICSGGGTLVYITDASCLPEETFAYLQLPANHPKVLVINALRSRPHPTHFTIQQALSAVQRINPQQAYFVHMTHDHTHTHLKEMLPPNVMATYDNLSVDL